MKIIINTSNLYVGGGLQVALSFLNELKQMEQKHEYHVFLSEAVAKQIDEHDFPANFKFYLIEKSPSSLKSRRRIVARLDALEEQIKPDIVFSVFGPTYWRPKSKHLMGFANGWVYNPDSVLFDMMSWLKKIKSKLSIEYKKYFIKRDAEYYVLETNDAKEKFAKILGIKHDDVFVIGNTYNSIFEDSSSYEESNESYLKLPEKEVDEFRFVYIAHNHPNKNLQIINEVIPLLGDRNIKFILTIDEKSYHQLFGGTNKNIITLGPIAQKSCPSVYKQCDALFAPTLLETFSAAYPEAMKMGKPILTSNYSFATDICEDAALYFDPLTPEDIARKITQLVDDKELQGELVKKGEKRLESFETARSRAEKYIALCERIMGEKS